MRPATIVNSELIEGCKGQYHIALALRAAAHDFDALLEQVPSESEHCHEIPVPEADAVVRVSLKARSRKIAVVRIEYYHSGEWNDGEESDDW